MTGFDTCDEANPELQVSKIGLSCSLKISRLVSARKKFPYPFHEYYSNQPSLSVRDGWTLTSLSFAVLSMLPVHNIYRERTWSISSHLVCTSLVREGERKNLVNIQPSCRHKLGQGGGKKELGQYPAILSAQAWSGRGKERTWSISSHLVGTSLVREGERKNLVNIQPSCRHKLGQGGGKKELGQYPAILSAQAWSGRGKERTWSISSRGGPLLHSQLLPHFLCIHPWAVF